MICEQCHVQMIERVPSREMDDADEGQVILLECSQCGRTEYQALITSFWRRLAA